MCEEARDQLFARLNFDNPEITKGRWVNCKVFQMDRRAAILIQVDLAKIRENNQLEKSIRQVTVEELAKLPFLSGRVFQKGRKPVPDADFLSGLRTFLKSQVFPG